MRAAPESFIHLQAAGVSVLLDVRGPGLPAMIYWGEDLGDHLDADALALAVSPALAKSAIDALVPTSLLPERSLGYRGRPGLTGSRAGGRDFSSAFGCTRIAHHGRNRVSIHARDEAAALSLDLELVLEPGGLLRVSPALTNEGSDEYHLLELACILPVPDRACELLDLSGRWLRERHPQRGPFRTGAHVREGRHGRTGHDASLLLAVGTAGFTNRCGEVWATHLAWSGDATTWAERGPALTPVLATSELLAPGELTLAPGERYQAPWTCAAYSARGLDGITAAFHTYLRARACHPRTPRPVTLNTWEAVYFDHDLAKLTALATRAAALGVERFVLDDGWFLGRRDATTSLGDWEVDPTLWPDGLTPLITHVTELGLQFGLWVEPEMISQSSELARNHPDWVLGVPGRTPPEARHQQVLDLTHADAYAHVLGRLDQLLTDNDISYLKWDHNRDLVEAADLTGRPAVHRQTLAVYELLDTLRVRHPRVEIESCASGGGRVDLGVLQRTDRVWPSDTNDPLERVSIQRWTQLLLPPELLGTHVGPALSHTTRRTSSLAFRVATALFGSFGIEWDLTSCTDDELTALATAVRVHKRLRPLLHAGQTANADVPDPSVRLHGVVSSDRHHALWAYVQLTTSELEVPAPVQFADLDPELVYLVRPLLLAGVRTGVADAPPAWWARGELRATGRTLMRAGLRMPVLDPEQAVLLELTSTS